MKRTVLRLLLWMNLLFVVIAYLSGCATTKPNTPFAGPYPQCFNELSAKNPLLANELAKLPELQDGVTVQEEKALDTLVGLFAQNPKVFNNAFKQMYRVGIPDVRKYCTPLQALFWLAEDKKYVTMEEIIQNYKLDNLLRVSWQSRFSISDSFHLSDEEAIEIARNHIVETDIGPMHQSRKKPYLSTVDEYLKTKDTESKKVIMENIKNKIHLDYKINKKRFTRKGRAIIKKYIDGKVDPRWSKFNTVVDRLNTPEFIHHYIGNNFRYQRGELGQPLQNRYKA